MAPARTSSEDDASAPLRGLAALLPEAHDASGNVVSRLLESLTEQEAQAVRQFRQEAHHCLGRLSGETLRELAMLGDVFHKACASTSSTLKGNKLAAGLKEGTECVSELFDKYDTDKDGILSLDEFRKAFGELTGGTFNAREIEQLVNAVDVNEDGDVDIHEFTAWLYNSAGQKSATDISPRPASLALLEKLEAIEAELAVKKRIIAEREIQHEEEMDATHDFWKSIAKHAVLTIDSKVDLQNSEWLGNGKYAFVLKAKRRLDDREVVVKMMGIRWSHLAVKEWQTGTLVGNHPNVVEYEEVMLHADNDSEIARLIKAGYDSGKLHSRTKRNSFPDCYICLTQELMNKGTVQDWMDKGIFGPGGLLCVLQQVASALAFMHAREVTHNDIKPENVMLNEEPGSGEVVVKLGDLGLARRCADRTTDFWQYGMTGFYMITGEKFGSRKYRPEQIEEFVDVCRDEVRGACTRGRLCMALQSLPSLFLDVFKKEVTMDTVSKKELIQGWGFYDTFSADELQLVTPPRLASKSSCSRLSDEEVHRKHVQQMGED